MSEIEFVVFNIIIDEGSSGLDGKYFIQYTGNKNALEKFKTINKVYLNREIIQFYEKKYTKDDIQTLLKFDCLWNETDSWCDNYERKLLFGKLNIPGKNKEYSIIKLEKWWKDSFGQFAIYNPNWSNVIDNVVNLNRIYLTNEEVDLNKIHLTSVDADDTKFIIGRFRLVSDNGRTSMGSRIIDWTDYFGIFDDVVELQKEYLKIKNEFETKQKVQECRYKRVIMNDIFRFNKQNFFLVKPNDNMDLSKTKIDTQHDSFSTENGDLLLLHADDEAEDDQIEYVYMIKNKFVNLIQFSNYMRAKDLLKLNPELRE